VQSAVLKKSLIVLPALLLRFILTADQSLHQIFVVSCWVGERKKPGSIFPNGIKVNEEQLRTVLSVILVTSISNLGC
jgi:hypothetical protein